MVAPRTTTYHTQHMCVSDPTCSLLLTSQQPRAALRQQNEAGDHCRRSRCHCLLECHQQPQTTALQTCAPCPHAAAAAAAVTPTSHCCHQNRRPIRQRSHRLTELLQLHREPRQVRYSCHHCQAQTRISWTVSTQHRWQQ